MHAYKQWKLVGVGNQILGMNWSENTFKKTYAAEPMSSSILKSLLICTYFIAINAQLQRG